jgi:hypothetical protein
MDSFPKTNHPIFPAARISREPQIYKSQNR